MKGFKYSYDRTFDPETGNFNIDGKLVGSGDFPEHTRVAPDIERAFPGKHFIVRNSYDHSKQTGSCDIIFQEELTDQDKKLLDKVIEDYKNNN